MLFSFASSLCEMPTFFLSQITSFRNINYICKYSCHIMYKYYQYYHIYYEEQKKQNAIAFEKKNEYIQYWAWIVNMQFSHETVKTKTTSSESVKTISCLRRSKWRHRRSLALHDWMESKVLWWLADGWIEAGGGGEEG